MLWVSQQLLAQNQASTISIDTQEIGTPEHPTIHGGRVNAFNDVTNKKRAVPIALEEKKKSKFHDAWATNSRVKKFLIKASQQHQLSHVLYKIEQMGLPASIALLPMVESNYNTQAVSPKGAAGSWQLMPETAKAYGIRAKERFQFLPATDAALRLLKNLHQQFGNWELVFAAYNTGATRVAHALQKNPQAITIDELPLPQETKTYVHRIKSLNQAMREMSTHV